MENLRRHERVAFPYPLEQIVQRSSDYPRLQAEDSYFSARGLDISEGGMLAESASPIEPMSHVFLMFLVPGQGGGRRISCEGHIVHSRFDGSRCVFGICFQELSAEDREAIDAFVSSVKPS